MRGFNAGVLVFVIFFIQGTIDATSLTILKAFLSPPMPRVKRISNESPRNIREKDPFAVSDFLGLVKQHNYPAEEHNVTTIDGYKLIIHRIPNSPNSPPAKRKPIVFLQHGLLASSDSWVLMGPGKDLAFLLADAGYDVWIGNFRGNSYSRSHTVLSPEDPAFWQFSFHEKAYYDLPAMIDHILEEAGQKSLTYIGHSMGTTCSYILLSSKPEYNKRLRLVISFAPVAYWKHDLVLTQKWAAQNGELLKDTFLRSGIVELAPQSSLNSRIVTAFCSDNSVTQPICVNTIFALSGFDYPQLNVSLIPYLSGYFPAGVSLKTLAHYLQHIVSGEFRQYDYGHVGNFEHYGQKESPEYIISNVTAPVVLFYGLGDFVSREDDARELAKKLPNLIKSTAVSHKSFNHIDFLWANEAKRILYDDVINLIHRFK